MQGYILEVNANLPVLRRHSRSIGWVKCALINLVKIGLKLLLACRVHVSAIQPVCTVSSSRNDVVAAVGFITTNLNLVHVKSNTLSNCNKVAGQCSHKEAIIGVGNILNKLNVCKWCIQLVNQLDSVVKFLNRKTILIILNSNWTTLTEHTVSTKIITC